MSVTGNSYEDHLLTFANLGRDVKGNNVNLYFPFPLLCKELPLSDTCLCTAP